MRLLEAAGYACSRAAADIVALVWMKTRDWLGSGDRPQADHRWRDRARLPDVKEA